MNHSVLDRRAALKARHRASIVAAARSLVDERSGRQFTVDELADRADVARRTVFNHFGSLDKVLLAVCEQAMAVVIDDFLEDVSRAPVRDGSQAALFDEIATAMREADLVTVIATMARILGPGESDARAAALTRSAFARVSERMLEEVSRRRPDVDALDAELLVHSLMSGLTVIATHWATDTGASTDADARAAWDVLLSRLLETVRRGYRPAPPR